MRHFLVIPIERVAQIEAVAKECGFSIEPIWFSRAFINRDDLETAWWYVHGVRAGVSMAAADETWKARANRIGELLELLRIEISGGPS